MGSFSVLHRLHLSLRCSRKFVRVTELVVTTRCLYLTWSVTDAGSTPVPVGNLIRLATECELARGPDADRHAKLLIHLAMEGSTLNAYLQSTDGLSPRVVWVEC